MSTEKADTTYVDNGLASVASGSPKTTYTTLALLQACIPTGNTSTYLTTDGNWNRWNGSAWVIGGVYQATGITNGSKSAIILNDYKGAVGKNGFNLGTAITGYYMPTTGVITVGADNFYSEFIDLSDLIEGTILNVNQPVIYVNFFDVNKVFLSGYIAGYQSSPRSFAKVANCVYIVVSGLKTVMATMQVELGALPTTYESYRYNLANLIPSTSKEVIDARGSESDLNTRLNKISSGNNSASTTYKLTSKLSEIALDFCKHWKIKDKDLVVIVLGDSISTLNNYTTLRTDASTRPPLMREFAYPSYIEELLRWDGQEYKRYDVASIFTEVCTSASSVEYDTAWDWTQSGVGNNKPSITRILEGTNCSTSYLVPSSASRCDFIFRTDYLNAPNAIVSISTGNGFVLVYDEATSTWIEANGYSYIAKEVDETITGSTGFPIRKSIYQKRLKMKMVVLEHDGNTRVTITNNGSGRLTYWGIQHSPLNFFIDFLAQARGGHHIAMLRSFEAWDVDYFKPDLILMQECTNNEGAFIGAGDGISPTHKDGNSPQAMAGRFLTYVNELEAKSYTPTVLCYALFHSYLENWLAKDSNKVVYAYTTNTKVTGFDYHDFLDGNMLANNKKQLLVWKCMDKESRIKAETKGMPIMECVDKGSGITGDTWTIDGTHHNNLGAKVIFEIMKNFFLG